MFKHLVIFEPRSSLVEASDPTNIRKQLLLIIVSTISNVNFVMRVIHQHRVLVTISIVFTKEVKIGYVNIATKLIQEIKI
mgnify:CR=1 FL=1